MSIQARDLRRAKELVAEKLGLGIPAHQEVVLAAAIGATIPGAPLGVGPVLDFLAAESPDGPAWQAIASRVTVCETSFFRHRAWFDTLIQHAIKPLIETRRQHGQRYLRLWCAGCATGEEPFTLAIILSRLIPDIHDWTISLVGTDINPDALRRARQATYKAWSMRELTPEERRWGFEPLSEGIYRVRTEIADLVRFESLNLAQASWLQSLVGLSALDVILCRNVIMYFTPEVQRRVSRALHDSLVPGGWVATSPAEASAQYLAPLNLVNFPEAILARRRASPVSGHEKKSETRQWVDGESGRRDGPQVPTMHSPRPLAPKHTGEVSPPATATRTDADSLAPARNLADQGFLTEAKAFCEAVLAKAPTLFEAHLLRATICAEMEDVSTALESVRGALFLQPHSASGIFLEATLLLRMGHVVRGKRRMNQALKYLSDLPADDELSVGANVTAGGIRQLARAYLGSADSSDVGDPVGNVGGTP